MQVLIAGAGLAGLCAARELGGAGCAVTIFDARDRLGGRVRTIRDGLPDGAHAELGAEFTTPSTGKFARSSTSWAYRSSACFRTASHIAFTAMTASSG